jgi:hypothetical protein
MISSDDLRFFVTHWSSNSLAAAARGLNVTPPCGDTGSLIPRGLTSAWWIGQADAGSSPKRAIISPSINHRVHPFSFLTELVSPIENLFVGLPLPSAFLGYGTTSYT